MAHLIDPLLGLPGWLVYLVIGLLAFGESAAFAGLLLPAETALLLGGVLAASGRISVAVLLAVAIPTAIAGDSVGYEIGRFAGPALRRGRIGRRIGEPRWERAQEYVRRRGGPAVFFGRWVGVLRALVPTLAGMTRMPYRRFLAWNVAGGATWAVTVVFAGYAAGAAWRRAAGYLGRAGVLLLLLLAAGAGLVLAARWAAGHQRRIRAAAGLLAGAGPVRAVRARLARPMSAAVTWAARRLDPGAALGLSLTLGLAVTAAACAGVAVVFDDVGDSTGIAALDRPVLAWLAAHRDTDMTLAMRAATQLGSAAVLTVVALLAAGVAGRLARSWRPVLLVAVTATGSTLLTVTGKALVGRDRPALRYAVSGAGGHSFPSGHSLNSAAILGVCAVLVWQGTRRWRLRVWAAAAATALVLLVGFSRLYLGVHWLTDVLAAYLLGLAWLVVVVTAFHPWTDRRHSPGRAPATPAAPPADPPSQPTTAPPSADPPPEPTAAPPPADPPPEPTRAPPAAPGAGPGGSAVRSPGGSRDPAAL